MMKNLTIRWRIGGSFVLILVLMTGLAVLAYVRLTRIEAETAGVDHSSLSGIADTVALERAWSDSLSLTTHRVLAPDSRRMDEALLANRESLRTAIDAAQASAVTPNAIRVLEGFKSAHAAYAQIQDQLLDDAADPVRRAQASQFLAQRLLPAFERGQVAVYSLLDLHRGYAKDSVARLNSDVVAAVAGTKSAVIIDLLGALALSVLCCVGLMLSIMRPLATLEEVVGMMRAGNFTRRVSLARNDEFGALAGGFNGMADDLTVLVGQVKDSGLKVSTSVTEIAATAREQQATANEVAATTAEIGATSREISATSKELVRTMADVSQAAEQSAAIAGNGQVSLTQMEQSMRNVVEAAGSVTTKLATLNEKAGDISQVVVTIAKVADQTNLLSLNAAIEAEKAGEYGRGFAVVATEIRRLADQTAVATHDIDRMVKAMQSAVSTGVMSMDKFSDEVRRGMQAIQQVGGQLSDVIQHTQALAPRFEAVTEGMQAQATGAEQITESLSQLTEAARQTVDSLRQSSAAIDDLNQVAMSLKTGVSKFTLQPA